MKQGLTNSTINLRCASRACWQNICLILLMLVLCITVFYGYYSITHVLQREYIIDFNYTILPENATTENNRLTNSDLLASASLGILYKDLYCDPTYTNRILEQIGIVGSNNNVRISSYETNSAQVFKMHISSSSATLTSMVLDAVTDDMIHSNGLPPGSKVIFCEDVHEIDMVESGVGSPKKYVAAGALLGFILAVAFISLRSILSCTVSEPVVLNILTDKPILAHSSVAIERARR